VSRTGWANLWHFRYRPRYPLHNTRCSAPGSGSSHSSCRKQSLLQSLEYQLQEWHHPATHANESRNLENTKTGDRSENDAHLVNKADDRGARLAILGQFGALLLQHGIATTEIEAETALGRHFHDAGFWHGRRERERETLILC